MEPTQEVSGAQDDAVEPESLESATDQDEVQKQQIDEAAEEEARDKAQREKEARAQALTLEIVGDLPYAEVKPPENVLFVCKLNPVTEDDDLETIFSRFGSIVSCEVIRDKRTRDSLQYAFIEFENQKDCEQAYFKMQGVLIDDHRIHVDFSQSVSRLSDKWRSVTNKKRAQGRGGFGGVDDLEKKRQYRGIDESDKGRGRANGHNMVFDKEDFRRRPSSPPPRDSSHPEYSKNRNRSQSPRGRRHRNGQTPPRDTYQAYDRSRKPRREEFNDSRRYR